MARVRITEAMLRKRRAEADPEPFCKRAAKATDAKELPDAEAAEVVQRVLRNMTAPLFECAFAQLSSFLCAERLQGMAPFLTAAELAFLSAMLQQCTEQSAPKEPAKAPRSALALKKVDKGKKQAKKHLQPAPGEAKPAPGEAKPAPGEAKPALRAQVEAKLADVLRVMNSSDTFEQGLRAAIDALPLLLAAHTAESVRQWDASRHSKFTGNSITNLRAMAEHAVTKAMELEFQGQVPVKRSEVVYRAAVQAVQEALEGQV